MWTLRFNFAPVSLNHFILQGTQFVDLYPNATEADLTAYINRTFNVTLGATVSVRAALQHIVDRGRLSILLYSSIPCHALLLPPFFL